jgi:hypothetical protein
MGFPQKAPLAPIMAAALFVAGFGAGGCAKMLSDLNVEHQADGTYRLKCRKSLPLCLINAEETCQGNRYVVLAAVDQHDYFGGTGVRQTEERASEAIIRCGSHGRPLGGPSSDRMPQPATAVVEPESGKAKSPPLPAHVCVPGATQACVGAGACRGGQSCLPDASGFSPCACGVTRDAPDEPNPASSAAPPIAAPPVATPPATPPRP